MAENEKLVKAWEHFYATTDIRPRIKKLYEVTLPNDSIEYWLRKPDVNEPKVMAWREVITEDRNLEGKFRFFQIGRASCRERVSSPV